MIRAIHTLPIAAVLACSITHATPVYTTPVGYVTQELEANRFNLFGITLHNPILISSSLTTVDGNVLGLTENIDALLNQDNTYILEVTSGSLQGLVQEFNTWNENSITLVINAQNLGLSPGDSFSIREATTLESTFGTVSSTLTKGFSSAAADIIWVPAGNGDYNRYYLHSTNVWRNVQTNTNTPNVPIVYTDGILIEKKAGSAEIQLTGEVKATSSSTSIASGFNILSVVYPTGTTLQNSGLSGFLTPGFSSANADIVWIPNGAGGFERYYFHSTSNWRGVINNTNLISPVNLPSAIFIERKAAATNVTITSPLEL